MNAGLIIALLLAQDPLAESAKRDLVLRNVPGAERITPLTDLGDSIPFDLYPAAVPNAPIVILIHGGPLPSKFKPLPRQWPAFQSLARILAASGMSAVLFDHHYEGFGNAGEAQSNIDEVIRYVRDHSAEFDLDANRMAIWCFSGGGVFLAPYLAERPPTMRALVAYYPMLSASADQHLSADGPPLLVARAGQDLAMLNFALDSFVQKARARKVDLELLDHPSGHHAFDTHDDDDRSRAILRRTIAFLAERLKPRP